MYLSIVTTLYRSETTVDEFHRRVGKAARSITDDYEIIMVDDGSPDSSLERACQIAENDPHVRTIELSRNFGHHKAMMTGLMHASGDLVFLIDSDLEEEPELLERFHEMLRQEGVDVVYGFQPRRKGNWLERTMGTIAFRVFDILMTYPMPRNYSTIRLMRACYVDALLQHREREMVIGGLWAITGFRQVGLPFTKGHAGRSTYTFWRRWELFLENIFSFSVFPLLAIFYLGILISGISALVGIWVIGSKLMFGALVGGWVSVMLSVWFLGGLLILFVGITGIYLSKIFLETKQRPYTLVRRVYGKTPPNGELMSRREGCGSSRPTDNNAD